MYNIFYGNILLDLPKILIWRNVIRYSFKLISLANLTKYFHEIFRHHGFIFVINFLKVDVQNGKCEPSRFYNASIIFSINQLRPKFIWNYEYSLHDTLIPLSLSYTLILYLPNPFTFRSSFSLSSSTPVRNPAVNPKGVAVPMIISDNLRNLRFCFCNN